MGNSAPAGICHSFTEDGRCVSLLKLLLTNVCIYDCAYCINRRTNDIPRATFKVTEIVSLTMELYKRNYIEGLFLSSGVIRNADYTMEAMLRVAKSLREEHLFGGYIHLKAIPGASPELIAQAGLYADRMSVNIEIPSESSLQLLAPEKSFSSVFTPIYQIREGIAAAKSVPRIGWGKSLQKQQRFVPAGQSTQMIVGASPENDLQILSLASNLYNQQQLKRVYYSGYVPVNADRRLPVLQTSVPLRRENRLYQADWLMRFYHFRYDEIVDKSTPYLDQDFDPKLAWALRHPEVFPIDLDRADYEMILRIPGIGVRSAKLIIQGRRFGRIRLEHLKRMGVALNRAKFFIADMELPRSLQRLYPEQVKRILLPPAKSKQISFLEHSSQILLPGSLAS